MNSPTSTSELAPLLGQPQVVTEPFQYAVLAHLDEPQSTFDRVLQWLEHDAIWERAQKSFYDQYELCFCPEAVPERVASVLNNSFLSRVLRTAEAAFGCDFYDLVKVGAHKLVPGQGIGIHTDRQITLGESHRFLIQLNRGWADEYGGHLILFNSNNIEDPHRVIRPLHGSAVAFHCTGRSYHAVCPVTNGVRFTLGLSLWAKDEKHPPAYPGAVEADNPGFVFQVRRNKGMLSDSIVRHLNAVDLLGAVNAAGTEHCKTTLLHHLYGTYEVLCQWGTPDHVQLAGLLHSVYGTAGFEFSSIPLTRRELVREAVGQHAERLAYLYCCVAPGSIIRASESSGESYHVLNRLTRSSELLSREEFRGLVLIELANTVDILARNPTEREKIGESGRQLARLARGLVDPTTLQTCLATFDAPA